MRPSGDVLRSSTNNGSKLRLEHDLRLLSFPLGIPLWSYLDRSYGIGKCSNKIFAFEFPDMETFLAQLRWRAYSRVSGGRSNCRIPFALLQPSTTAGATRFFHYMSVHQVEYPSDNNTHSPALAWRYDFHSRCSTHGAMLFFIPALLSYSRLVT